MNQRQQPPWLVNNILFYYEGDKHTRNVSVKNQHLLQHKKKHSSSKEAYTEGSKSTGRKVGYAAVFTNNTRRGALPEEASIHSNERDKTERAHKMGNIYRLVKFNAGHRKQQRKSPNTKSDMTY